MKPKLDYSIINKDWICRIFGFNLQRIINSEFETYIDITLKENDEIKVLRFLNPSQIEFESRYSRDEHILGIYDLSDSGMEYVNLKVEGTVTALGNFSFWAEDVFEII